MIYIFITLLAMFAPGPLAVLLAPKQSGKKTHRPVENEDIFNSLFLNNHK